MRDKTLSISLRAGLGILTVTLLGTSSWATPKERVLHSFNNSGKDGGVPVASLVLDAAGDLYGTTYYGGTDTSCNGGCGTVFELTPQAGGGWKEKVIYHFGDGKGGASPNAGVIFDVAGNLYGTTTWGGSYGAGTVRVDAQGGWGLDGEGAA